MTNKYGLHTSLLVMNDDSKAISPASLTSAEWREFSWTLWQFIRKTCSGHKAPSRSRPSLPTHRPLDHYHGSLLKGTFTLHRSCAVFFHDIQNHFSSHFLHRNVNLILQLLVSGSPSWTQISLEQSLIREIILWLFHHNADPASKDVSAAWLCYFGPD